MGFFNKAGKFLGHLVDVRVDKWTNLPYLTRSLHRTREVIQESFTPDEPQRVETFEEAMERLQLTDETLHKRVQEFTRLIVIYSFIVLAMASYSGSMFYQHNFWGGLIGLGLTLFCAAHIFRFHFWRFTILQRKLGLHFEDWMKYYFGEAKK